MESASASNSFSCLKPWKEGGRVRDCCSVSDDICIRGGLDSIWAVGCSLVKTHDREPSISNF